MIAHRSRSLCNFVWMPHVWISAILICCVFGRSKTNGTKIEIKWIHARIKILIFAWRISHLPLQRCVRVPCECRRCECECAHRTAAVHVSAFHTHSTLCDSFSFCLLFTSSDIKVQFVFTQCAHTHTHTLWHCVHIALRAHSSICVLRVSRIFLCEKFLRNPVALCRSGTEFCNFILKINRKLLGKTRRNAQPTKRWRRKVWKSFSVEFFWQRKIAKCNFMENGSIRLLATRGDHVTDVCRVSTSIYEFQLDRWRCLHMLRAHRSFTARPLAEARFICVAITARTVEYRADLARWLSDYLSSFMKLQLSCANACDKRQWSR